MLSTSPHPPLIALVSSHCQSVSRSSGHTRRLLRSQFEGCLGLLGDREAVLFAKSSALSTRLNFAILIIMSTVEDLNTKAASLSRHFTFLSISLTCYFYLLRP